MGKIPRRIMSNLTASAIAHPNIAFIKYWGNCEPEARIPANGSISMNLSGLETRTSVAFDAFLSSDDLTLNRQPAGGAALGRVSDFLDHIRQKAGINHFARVESENNFPMGAGIASSASAFAALALAASTAAGLELNESELSRLARLGSGSACRSIPGGFTDHWNLVDCVAIVSQEHKLTGSTEGHALAHTSPIQSARVADAPRRLKQCRQAILDRDFESFAEVTELDCNLMHAVMMTSTPRLIYWQPATLAIIQWVQARRQEGIQVCYTVDAGPNVHVLCTKEYAMQVEIPLRGISGVKDVLTSSPGGPAKLLDC
jgi:diphosphomevalonate decarboxylase